MINGKKIGFTCSAFDLFHAGHVQMLAEAHTQCDYLIVGLQVDPNVDRPAKNKPVQSLVERQIQVRGCRYVDEVWVYHTEQDLEELLLTLPIDVRILGQEYKGQEFTGKAICEKRNIELYFNSRDHGFSTTGLRDRVYNQEKFKHWME